MAFLSSRSSRDHSWLEWKIRLFSVAAVLSLVGIYFDERWVIGVAIMVLALGMVLRFVPGSDLREREEDQNGHASFEQN